MLHLRLWGDHIQLVCWTGRCCFCGCLFGDSGFNYDTATRREVRKNIPGDRTQQNVLERHGKRIQHNCFDGLTDAASAVVGGSNRMVLINKAPVLQC